MAEFSWRRTEHPEPHTFTIQFVPLDPVIDWAVFHYIYIRLMQTNGMRQTFWGIPATDQIPFPEFLFSYAKGTDRFLTGMFIGDDLIGILYLSETFTTHRVSGGVWIDYPWRGVNGWLIGREILRYVHGTLGYHYMYSTTPWEAAKQFCSKAGMQAVAEIPGFCMYNGKILDVEVFMSDRDIVMHAAKVEREQWEAEKEVAVAVSVA